jgi:hypothetical protein
VNRINLLAAAAAAALLMASAALAQDQPARQPGAQPADDGKQSWVITPRRTTAASPAG